ncbi:hypothetical protein [Ralstonia pseudosolanacearum]|uniref:hypothetical protein n=1 Tax=Ralstonia pseudosolanacearum TaxID=1310165 RepID=UPI00339A8A98
MKNNQPSIDRMSLAANSPWVVRNQSDGGRDVPYYEAIFGGPGLSTWTLFRKAAISSLALRGQPVRCSGIVPGATLWISTGSIEVADRDEAERIANALWTAFRPSLVDWVLACQNAASAGLTVSISDGVRIQCGWDGRYILPEGAMQLDVRYDPAFASSYAMRFRHAPLIEPMPGSPDCVLELVQSAIQKCIRSEDDLYARLPVPVRYRAGGAIEAWTQVRQAAGRSGEEFSRHLAEQDITYLYDCFADYVCQWADRPLLGITNASSVWYMKRSIVWQAFNAREGMLYEPTPALHRLLDASYIADDVPVGTIRLPAKALCIIPDPSWWDREDGVEAIALFQQSLEVDGRRYDSLNVVAWGHHARREHRVVNVLQLSLADPQRTIGSLVEDIIPEDGGTDSTPEPRRYWLQVLDYAIKMLLYLTVRDAQIVHDRAYTDAPRDFTGLGKRKRAQRLADIEQLYDRHIVGPAILDMAAVDLPSADGAHHEVRGHWRRPHFKMQPHGPNGSLRKLMFIGPTIVRPDRLGM